MSEQSVLDMAAEDSESFKRVNSTDADKARVSELTFQLVEAEREVFVLEQELKKKKAHLTKLEQFDLPEAMDKVGLESFKTKNGATVKVDKFFQASISGERKEDVLDWLEAEGHGSIIVTEVKVTFGKEQLEDAKAFVEFARGFNQVPVSPELSRNVNTGTFKSLVKELDESGETLPLETLGVHKGRKAKVKLAKSID